MQLLVFLTSLTVSRIRHIAGHLQEVTWRHHSAYLCSCNAPEVVPFAEHWIEHDFSDDACVTNSIACHSAYLSGFTKCSWLQRRTAGFNYSVRTRRVYWCNSTSQTDFSIWLMRGFVLGKVIQLRKRFGDWFWLQEIYSFWPVAQMKIKLFLCTTFLELCLGGAHKNEKLFQSSFSRFVIGGKAKQLSKQ